jgi:hypothetical protein
VKRRIPAVLLFLMVFCISVPSTGQQANAHKDIFFAERGCPLVSASPVTGPTVELKNVGQKTITSYRLACFRRGTKEPRVDLVFEESADTIPPNEGIVETGFDAVPANVCRWRKELIGVYESTFSDGTSWKTASLR